MNKVLCLLCEILKLQLEFLIYFPLNFFQVTLLERSENSLFDNIDVGLYFLEPVIKSRLYVMGVNSLIGKLQTFTSLLFLQLSDFGLHLLQLFSVVVGGLNRIKFKFGQSSLLKVIDPRNHAFNLIFQLRQVIFLSLRKRLLQFNEPCKVLNLSFLSAALLLQISQQVSTQRLFLILLGQLLQLNL